jgi:hypothetical protein
VTKPAARKRELDSFTLRWAARLALKWKFSFITNPYARGYNAALVDVARDLREQATLESRQPRKRARGR